MLENLLYYMVKGAAAIVQILPIAVSLQMARWLANIIYCLDKRRYVAYTNMKAAFGNEYTPAQIRSLVRKTYVHFLQMLVEILYFPKMNKAYMDRYIKPIDFHYYEDLVRAKKGVMALTAHYGNWEMLQIYSEILGYPLFVLVREQKLSKLDEFLNQLRAHHQTKPIYNKGIAIRNIIRALRDGSAVGVLGDQGGGRSGARVEFFGRKTTSPTGIYAIASKTGAAVVPAFCRRTNGPYHELTVLPPLKLIQTGNEEDDERENSRQYLIHLETFIRKNPENWLWMHKRWKLRYTKRTIILEDVKAGHAAQARAIAQALDKTSLEFGNDPLAVERISVQFKSPFSQFLFLVASIFLLPFSQSRLHLLRLFLKEETIKKIEAIPYADFIISSGSKLVPLNLWLSHEYRAKKVVVMKPPFPYNLYRYDLLVLPKHDTYHGAKSWVVKTVFAPNLATEASLNESKEQLRKDLNLNGRMKVAVFIGGKSKAYRFDASKFKMLLNILKEEAERSNLDLLITTSRRTEQEFEKMLKNSFLNHPHCKLLVVANEKNIENVTYAMLGLSDIVIVTEDSVSMISEAVSASKSVIVAEVGNEALSSKHTRFKQILAEEKFIRVAAPAQLPMAIHQAQQSKAPRHLIESEQENIRKALWSLL